MLNVKDNSVEAQNSDGAAADAKSSDLEKSGSDEKRAGILARLASYEQMIDEMPVNIITCDLRDFKITFVNETTKKTLKPLEHLLPCKADELVGQCIDIFHKDPSFQRNILSDPTNLPHQAHIKLGNEYLDLLITAIRDTGGSYVGAMLTWSVITEKLKIDREAAQLKMMVENMPINVMMCDPKDFTVTYANSASIKTLEQLEHLLPIKAANLVGSCIDIFHKDPSHQRRILADPKNLPHTAQIMVGEEILDLLVSPIYDKDGGYVGPMLTWSVITEKAKADAHAAQLTQMVENMPVGVIMCDPEKLEINYMNKFSTETLKTLESYLPVKVDNMLGQCIDIFHKDPSHQRRIISDPKNLPHSAQITVGPEILDLLVTAIYDRAGNYMGPMLTWSVITAKVKADAQAAQLTQMVEGMPIGVMMCDPEKLEINYMNKFSSETLKTLEQYLPVKVDDMMGQCIDIFHKDPSHQRRIISDPKNLPHSAQITVGPEILDLLVSPIFDKNGDYLGPMLTWSVITAKAKADAQAAQLTQMVEGMPIGVMMCDPEKLEINYMNKFSSETLKTLEQYLPVKVDNMMGQCIDIFHKDPSHQRRIISDPKNLPHNAQITVGPEILDLLVTPIFNKDGDYLGPMLTWSVVTAKAKADAQAAQLTQMVEGMPIGVIMCDPEKFEINYMNKFSTETLKTLETYLPVKVDDMMGQCIDIFHKDPSHQRRIIGDPKNLPHNGQITVGPEILDLLVTPIFNKDGDYLGPMLTWSVITAKAKADAQAEQLTQMVEGMPIGVMMCDPEKFEINYMNKFSTETLKSLESYLPVKAHDMMGQCIDIFHKDPSHQRRIIGDPKNLPHSAQITVGPEILDLLVTPIFDKAGEYLGPMLSWSVVTEKAKADSEAARLLQMLDTMPVNVMMAEPENWTITYANKSTVNTLRPLEHLLPVKADDLVGQCVDIFHKDPSHQRRILSNPDNLPHKANVNLGEHILALEVAAIRDNNGNYLGPMLTWTVVTGQVNMAKKVAEVVNIVAGASTELESTAQSMSATSEETSTQAAAVASAAEEATSNVQTVASAAEELSASITEISRQVAESHDIAKRAVEEADQTNKAVAGLAEAAQKIGDVVSLINDIASQTNLLALNATIEAARAGEAGKGFAVVASEVKTLANQTAKATEEISAQVSAMQATTDQTVTAIQSIGKTIEAISETATAIASAVEEQQASTQEISRNVQEAAAGTQEVSSNIGGVTQAAAETGASSNQVLDSSRQMMEQTELLRTEIVKFLEDLGVTA